MGQRNFKETQVAGEASHYNAAMGCDRDLGAQLPAGSRGEGKHLRPEGTENFVRGDRALTAPTGYASEK